LNHDDTTDTTKCNCFGQDLQEEQDVIAEQVSITARREYRKLNPDDPVNPVYELRRARRARRVVVVNPSLIAA
jgi:hypothetical protein